MTRDKERCRMRGFSFSFLGQRKRTQLTLSFRSPDLASPDSLSPLTILPACETTSRHESPFTVMRRWMHPAHSFPQNRCVCRVYVCVCELASSSTITECCKHSYSDIHLLINLWKEINTLTLMQRGETATADPHACALVRVLFPSQRR